MERKFCNKYKKNDNKIKVLLSEEETNRKDGVISDPLGSYTGVPVNKKEKPVQDADDL